MSAQLIIERLSGDSHRWVSLAVSVPCWKDVRGCNRSGCQMIRPDRWVPRVQLGCLSRRFGTVTPDRDAPHQQTRHDSYCVIARVAT